MGKNPVSLIVREWPEIGFFREYLVTGEEMGKNPVSLVVRECPETSVSPKVRQGFEPLAVVGDTTLLLVAIL